MHTMQTILSNIQTGAKPPAHMRRRGYQGARTTINLDALAERCSERGVDVNDIIALALTEEMREEMGFKLQADLAWKVMDKNEPSKRATEVTGPNKEPVRVIIEG